jgi:hypothetical protein
MQYGENGFSKTFNYIITYLTTFSGKVWQKSQKKLLHHDSLSYWPHIHQYSKSKAIQITGHGGL